MCELVGGWVGKVIDGSRTTWMFLNPLSTRVLSSSQPMPPAPTVSTFAEAICEF